VPFKVSASAVASVNPFKSRAAPVVTVVPKPIVPNGVFAPLPAAPSFNVPTLIVVKPVYVFAPESVSMPAPVFVRDNAPVPFERTPEKVVLAALLIVKVTAAEFVIVPVPVRSPTLVANPKDNVFPEATVRAPVTVNGAAVPCRIVLPLMVKLATVTVGTAVIGADWSAGIVTASAAPGSAPPDQLVVVIQSPPFVGIQDIGAARAGVTGKAASTNITIIRAAMNLAVVW